MNVWLRLATKECKPSKIKMKYFSFVVLYFLIFKTLQEVWLDKISGRVCMSISARALSITGIEDRRYWNWIPTEESRFEFSKLIAVSIVFLVSTLMITYAKTFCYLSLHYV